MKTPEYNVSAVLGLCIAGIGAIFFLLRSPRQFNDDSMYHVTWKRGASVVSQRDESGRELNRQEPSAILVSRVVGSILLIAGGFLFYREFRSGRL